MKRLLIFGCLVATLGCSGSDDKDACASDSECKGDRICSDGACVDPGGDNSSSTGEDGRIDGSGDVEFGNNEFGDDDDDDDGSGGGDDSNNDDDGSFKDYGEECDSDFECSVGLNCRADSTSGPFTCR